MKIESLESLFVEELKDIYDAEKQITKALPKLIRMAQSTELQNALSSHLKETQNQMQRLEEAFAFLGVKSGRKRCAGMLGIIDEGNQMLEEVTDGDTLDAAIICSAQRVEHYEIAVYGCLRTWASMLGYDDISEQLQESLNEEDAADQLLSQIATKLNVRAAHVEANPEGSKSKSR